MRVPLTKKSTLRLVAMDDRFVEFAVGDLSITVQVSDRSNFGPVRRFVNPEQALAYAKNQVMTWPQVQVHFYWSRAGPGGTSTWATTSWEAWHGSPLKKIDENYGYIVDGKYESVLRPEKAVKQARAKFSDQIYR